MWEDFTNLYSLSKTLRFELKPLPATRKFLQLDELEKENLFLKDREKAENYLKIKYYLDLLHRDFIDQSLVKFKDEKENIDFEKAYGSFKKEAAKDNNVESENQQDEERVDESYYSFSSLRSKVAKQFKGNGYLFDAKVIENLENHYQRIKNELLEEAPEVIFLNTESEHETIFHNFKGFTGYLHGFHENRKNLYKTEGKAGQIPTRIIDQNLPRFFKNINRYGKLSEKYPETQNRFDAEWEDYFKERAPELSKPFENFGGWYKIFEPNFYNYCLLQRDIEFYNYLIRKLNKDINELKQILKSEKDSKSGGTKLPFFEELHKQILGEVKKKSDFIDITRNTLGGYLEEFVRHSDAKFKLSNEILDYVFPGTDIEGIYISNQSVNNISSKWFVSWDLFSGKILERQNEGLSESKKRKKLDDFVSLPRIKELLESMKDTDAKDIFRNEYAEKLTGNNHWKNFLKVWQTEWDKLSDEYNEARKNLKDTIPSLPKDKEMPQKQKLIIKRFADTILDSYRMTKYFALLKGIKEIEKADKNDEFYSKMNLYLFGDSLKPESEQGKENNIYLYYNAFKNFLTKKPWSEDKLKLNFENGSLLNGWSQSKEDEYGGVLFVKDGLYYFGILRSNQLFDYRFREEDIYSGSGENRRMKSQETIKRIWERKEKLKQQITTSDEAGWKKVEYFVIADPVKDVPGLLLSRANFQNKNKFQKMYDAAGGKFTEIERIKKEETFKGKNRSLKDLHTIVDYYKTIIPKTREKDSYNNFEEYFAETEVDGYSNWRCFDFNFSEAESYKDFSEFLSEVQKCGYKINTLNVSDDYINKCVENGNLYLFQIYNKDFQLDEALNGGQKRKVTGNDDAETSLLKLLFHEKNLRNEDGVVLALNGGAEVFFRPWSLEKKNQKEERNGKNIIAKKRYTENKIALHVPITLNYGKSNGRYFQASNLVNTALQNAKLSKKVKIIAIDRGEKHLAYYTVIDQEENILDQGTLNRIYPKKKGGSPVELYEKKIVLKDNENGEKRYALEPTGKKVNYVDYQQILDCKERNRLLQRKSWDSIENIKDFKKGFTGHAVNRLCELFWKYLEQDGVPPMIVFENLNIGFKQGRQKIEKQVYQNLELALAKRLSYLTRKFEHAEDQLLPGGVLNAPQFVPEVKNYSSDIEKKSQVGVLLYTDPSYTSTTCPNCGFRKRMTKTSYESVGKTKAKLESHKLKITYADNKYQFTFVTTNKSEDETTDTVYSDVSRIYHRPKTESRGWTTNTFDNMTKPLNTLLENNDIDKTREIYEQVKTIQGEDFWKKFMWYMNLILQIRNSSSVRYSLNEHSDMLEAEGENRDFIHCPHCLFHSDKPETWQQFSLRFPETVREQVTKRGEELFNGDSTGSYNIARKGNLMITRIQKHPEEIENFIKRNHVNLEYVKDKFNKNSGKCEIASGVGKNKKVLDSINKYPELYISNEAWDESLDSGKNF